MAASEAPPADPAVEVSPPVKNSEDVTLDAILKHLGQFGRFQLIIFLLICLPMMFHAMFSVTYVFTAATVTHRCSVEECDLPGSNYYELYTDWSIPKNGKDLDSCNRYINSELPHWNYSVDICTPDHFTKNTEACAHNKFVFRDDEVTISNDFGIFCDDEWKLSMVGTINNLGQFFGIPIGGFVADRYGRSFSIALGGILGAVLGVIRSFSPSYGWFLVFEFLDNMTSSTLYSTCFVIGIELVGPKRRVLACSVITVFYAVGEVLLAMSATPFHDWRMLLRITYGPSLILLAYFWILPGSVRWRFCSMMGRFGSMLAPQTPLLAKYYANAPAMLFAGAAIVSGLLTLFFPETTNVVLPTTVQEADAIGVKKHSKSKDLDLVVTSSQAQ
ncbi:uncharacterized protein Dyak_GE27901 [Drosophila yakuba]|uniref:Major facilitator superfamily (MFS) profile domain-containing protein n=1 Tax=Drosophila yakuba TaxID=7245 RepID=A0A0R1E7W4_DROYA|nr:uncharacterized protein Dyak_GE27901 [Drosophila yakuba]